MMRWILAAMALLFSAVAMAGDAQTAFERGEQALRTGQLEAARAAFQEALNQAPDSVEARLRLAGIQVASQDHTAAIANFQKVIGLQPDNARAFAGLGLAYLHQERYGPARAALQQAMELDPARRGEIERLLDWIDGRADMASAGQTTTP